MKNSTAISKTSAAQFSQSIINWYHQFGRKHLPWQQNKTPYRVWVSEIMLQQTQVTTVIPYYHKFMQSFPTVYELANADEDLVLHHWTGLGYYARARNLHQTAKIIVEDFDGEFPTTLAQVMALPGIGKSTAGAILSLALNKPLAILDGNVKRVLSRAFRVDGHNGQKTYLDALWQLTETLTPKENTQYYNQAMMDIGANICTRTKPNCEQCPIQSSCLAKQFNLQAEYPQKKPKKTKPEKACIMVIFRHQNQLLLEKRPPTGIWGGLWCFFQLETQQQIASLQSKLGLIESNRTELNTFRHTFTHFHLDISPIIIDCEEQNVKMISDQNQQLWYDLYNPDDVGLAASTKQLIQLLTPEPKS